MLDEAGKISSGKWIMILVVLAVVGIVAAYAFKEMGNLPPGDEGSGGGQPMDVPAAIMIGPGIAAAVIISPAVLAAPKHHAAGGKDGHYV